MSVFVCGDIHGSLDIHKLSFSNWPESKDLTENDYLVILGDFGLIWNSKFDKEEKYWLEWLCDKPYNVCFIDGNHENFNRLFSNEFTQYYDGEVGGYIKEIYNKNGRIIRYLERGTCFNFNTNYKFFVLGGAQSVDKKYRIENKSWWKQELPDIDDIVRINKTLLRYNFKFDFVFTHAIPLNILIRCGNIRDISNFPHKTNVYNKMELLLETIDNMIEYKKWFCGHYHIDCVCEDKYYFCYNNKPIKVI